jgi:hypothetical protein
VCAIGDHVENLRDAAQAAEVLARALERPDLDAPAEAGLARLIETTVREAAEAIEQERHRLGGRGLSPVA